VKVCILKTPIYNPNSDDHYDLLRQFASSLGDRWGVSEWEDVLHDALLEIDEQRKTYSLSYVKGRISSRLKNELRNKAREERVLSLDALAEQQANPPASDWDYMNPFDREELEQHYRAYVNSAPTQKRFSKVHTAA